MHTMLTNIKSLPSWKYFHFPTAFRIISSTSQTLLSSPVALVPYPLTREAALINVYSLNTPNSFLPGRPLHMPVPFLEALPLPCTWKTPSLPSCLTLYIISSKSPSLDQIAEGGLWFCFCHGLCFFYSPGHNWYLLICLFTSLMLHPTAGCMLVLP